MRERPLRVAVIGAGGIGFSLLGGIGPVPSVFARANAAAAAASDSRRILVVFEWFGGNDGLNGGLGNDELRGGPGIDRLAQPGLHAVDAAVAASRTLASDST